MCQIFKKRLLIKQSTYDTMSTISCKLNKKLQEFPTCAAPNHPSTCIATCTLILYSISEKRSVDVISVPDKVITLSVNFKPLNDFSFCTNANCSVSDRYFAVMLFTITSKTCQFHIVCGTIMQPSARPPRWPCG